METKWYPEVAHFCPNVPIVLAATMVDLRDDSEVNEQLQVKYRRGPITYKEGKAMAKKIGACKYVECSAVTLENVKQVFEEAARAAVNRFQKPQKSAKCTLL